MTRGSETVEDTVERLRSSFAELLKYHTCFNQWICITYMPTRKQLQALALRGVAVVCMINAPGIDLLIPLIPPDLNTDPDEHGTDIRIFSIQVKCLVSEQRADAAVHEKMGRSYAFSGSDLSEGEDPYVTLYLQVGAPTSSKPEWVLTHDVSQISFEIFGLDEIHFLTHQECRELKETLSSIARAWLDPLKLPQPSWLSSDLKTRLVRWTRSMMPLIYTGPSVFCFVLFLFILDARALCFSC